MSDWIEINQYHARNGEWTITNAPNSNVPKPFGLYRNNEYFGHFATSKEAVEKFKSLTIMTNGKEKNNAA